MGNGRPESYYDNINPPSASYNGTNNRRFGPRNHSDPTLYGNNYSNNIHRGAYPSHGHQPSYETVGTASNGSHVTDPWGNSTDPSSENSSIDRAQPAAKTEPSDNYGFSGFGNGPQFQGPILEEHGLNLPSYGQPGYGQSQMLSSNANGYPYQGNDVHPHIPPHVPPHGAPISPPREKAPPRVPIKLGANDPSNRKDNSRGAKLDTEHDKRKSWIKKRFSRG